MYGHNTYNSYSRFCASRNQQRIKDMTESRAILLELGCYEPTVQQALKIIQANVLGQGLVLKIDGTECSKSFKRHIELHYVPFLREALRAMLLYGFVPYRFRKIETGDKVPDVLPPGSFTWESTLVENKKDRKRPLQCKEDEGKLVGYRVIPSIPGVKEQDISIYNYISATYQVNENFTLYSTVISPLSHVLNDFRLLKNAQAQRSHADAWNCTSQIITTFTPAMKVQDDPSSAYLEFVDAVETNPYFSSYKQYFPQLRGMNWYDRSKMITSQIENMGSNHAANVYCLPRDHQIAPQANLTPVEDIPFLYDKFQRNLAALIGIPYEMLAGNATSNENTRKTMTTGRIFISNMLQFCSHSQALLTQVYCEIYGTSPERVEFTLTPMPRLEVESIEDLKVLYEIGCLNPDAALHLSKVLLGHGPKIKNKDKPDAKQDTKDLDKEPPRPDQPPPI